MNIRSLSPVGRPQLGAPAAFEASLSRCADHPIRPRCAARRRSQPCARHTRQRWHLKMQIVEAGKCTALDLPPAAAVLLRTQLKEMAAGRAVTIVPTEAEITTGEAAGLLHVSRPFVVGLTDKGELPARMVAATGVCGCRTC